MGQTIGENEPGRSFVDKLLRDKREGGLEEAAKKHAESEGDNGNAETSFLAGAQFMQKENMVLREALEFYAGKTKFGKWEMSHFYTYDKFGGLCNDTIGPAIALKALADSSQGSGDR